MATHSFHEDSEQCYCGATTRMGEFYVAAVARWKEEPDAIEQLVANNIRMHSEKAAAQAALARAEQALEPLRKSALDLADRLDTLLIHIWPEKDSPVPETRAAIAHARALAAATTTQPPAAASDTDGLCPRCGCCSAFEQADGSWLCITRCDVPGRHEEVVRQQTEWLARHQPATATPEDASDAE